MPPPSEPTILLLHGTTRQRAEAIVLYGPDPNFKEPGGVVADGISMAPTHGPYPQGSPEDVARHKAALFPAEGGPAILEIEISLSILNLAYNYEVEIRFELDAGLSELVQAWPLLRKQIRLLKM